MKKLYYWRFECMSLSEVAELMEAFQGTMAIQVLSYTSNCYSLSAYGAFDGDAEDWGLEDASCGMFQGEPIFESTKKLYETLKANGEF